MDGEAHDSRDSHGDLQFCSGYRIWPNLEVAGINVIKDRVHMLRIIEIPCIPQKIVACVLRAIEN
jgi:hypothetical protein